MDLIEGTFDQSHALVFRIGGGGDVVEALPTVRLLEEHGGDTVIDELARELSVVNPQPGPRSLDELEHADQVSEALAMGTAENRTHDGVRFAETAVAAQLDCEVSLLASQVGSRDSM